jgi:hypothetical protein
MTSRSGDSPLESLRDVVHLVGRYETGGSRPPVPDHSLPRQYEGTGLTSPLGASVPAAPSEIIPYRANTGG